MATSNPISMVNGQATSSPVTPSANASVDADGLAPALVLRKSFASGGGGSPDDVIIYNANAPFGFRILSRQIIVTTAVALSTMQLRSASGGGGSALSDAMSAAAAGLILDLNLIVIGTQTVATNGSIFLRRSDSGIAGEIIITLQKT